jgi:uncharacterized protein (TIGR03437 family)
MRIARVFFLGLAALLAAAPLGAQTATPAPFNAYPTRVVGQASIGAMDYSVAPNIADSGGLWGPGAVALDMTSSSPALYVSDTSNNRVLGWVSAASFMNGAPADIVIGQRDMVTTNPQGPGTSLTRGLHWPTGIAVDAQGNLYVIDAGNNRILRYPRPFDNADNRLNPDVLIGQAGYTTSSANRGASIPAADGIYTHSTYASFTIAQQLKFDANGNLWFTDTGNNRVLRFPKSTGDDKVQGTADIVLGQASFTTNTALPFSAAGAKDKTGLRYPVGVTLDSAGRIYVSDSLSRVLVYGNAPLPSGTAALRLLGIVYVPPGQQAPATPNAIQLGTPMGLVMVGNNLGVADAAWNRVVFFDPYDSWPADAENTSSPPAKFVIGQPDLTTGTANAANTGLRTPFQAAWSGSELFVADEGNNRVLVFPQGFLTPPGGTPATAIRVLGQRDFGYSAANLIEGKELYLFNLFYTISGFTGTYTDSGGVAVDSTSNPPHLYISDTYNNRVLGFRDARNVRPGDSADLIIGQPDVYSSGINGTLNSETLTNDAGLYQPAGVAVDDGNLYVADRANSRVLRFPRPFDQPAGATQHANLVLGQRDFTSPKNTDVSASNMAAPYGLAFMPEGHLLVSDRTHNRVLIFKKDGGDFSNGMAAAAVFGQPNFITSTTTQGVPNRMVGPRGIAVDSNGRLFVADMGNNRILVYSQVASTGPGDDPTPVLAVTNSCSSSVTSCSPVALRSPIGVAASRLTGEIWVAEALGASNSGRLLRYPEFSQLTLSPFPNFILQPGTRNTGSPPLAVALDGFGNLVVAEYSNRVSFYFPPLWATSAANFLPNVSVPGTYTQPCCAPGGIAVLWPFSPSGTFGPIDTAQASAVPLPTMLGDVQVVLSRDPDYAETLAPLYLVSPGQINFEVPKSAPTTSTVDVTVVRPSSGQVLATGSLMVRSTSPALFMNTVFPSGMTGRVQAVAQNNGDSPVSCNGIAGTPSDPVYCPGGVRPARRGEIITLYATGQGLVDGMPDDGAAGNGETTSEKPFVIIGTSRVPDANVEFSGRAPTLVGVWQINVKIPDNVAPGTQPIAVTYRDFSSSVAGNPATVIQVQ